MMMISFAPPQARHSVAASFTALTPRRRQRHDVAEGSHDTFWRHACKKRTKCGETDGNHPDPYLDITPEYEERDDSNVISREQTGDARVFEDCYWGTFSGYEGQGTLSWGSETGRAYGRERGLR